MKAVSDAARREASMLMPHASSWGELAGRLEHASNGAQRIHEAAVRARDKARRHEQDARAAVTVALERALLAEAAREDAEAKEKSAGDAAKVLATEAALASDQAKQFILERNNGAPRADALTGEVVDTPTSANFERDVWDLHVAVHCATPTANPQPAPIDDAELAAVDVARVRVKETAEDLSGVRNALARARAEYFRLQDELAKATERKEASVVEEERVVEWRKTEAARRRVLPHDKSSTHAAWRSVLAPLKGRLHQLHEQSVVECATLGYVSSDAAAWRQFWMRRGSASPRPLRSSSSAGSSTADQQRSNGSVQQCVAPRQLCYCALCAARGHASFRSGAPESAGKDGCYIDGNGVGTRVAGVVRMRGDSPGAAMDLLCHSLAEALHECHGPVLSTKGVDHSDRDELAKAARLFDVTWHATPKAAMLPGPTPPTTDGRFAPLPDARAPNMSVSSPSSRPFKSNPHSALVLDVQIRLLRTTGASFSYVSGRSQADKELPYFGIGRLPSGFEADKSAFQTSFSVSGRRSNGRAGNRAAPHQRSPRRVRSGSPQLELRSPQ